MAKPTQDPKWVTTDDPVNIIEPSAGAKLNGITSGGIWAREHLNWMFNSLSKWVDWIRDNVRSNTENDARYIQGQSGTADSNFQTNAQNRAEFALKSSEIYYNSVTLSAPSLNLTSGSCKIVRVGDTVTITGDFITADRADPGSSNNFLPSWALPTDEAFNLYFGYQTTIYRVTVNSSGNLKFRFYKTDTPTAGDVSLTATQPFTISYCVPSI